MLLDPITEIPLQTLTATEFNKKQLDVSVLRTDQTDPLISGNKWFKLKYNLHEACQQGAQTLISFGGAYSNHLHALAAAGKKFNFKTIGIIRGEQHLPLNPTLADVQSMGMALFYLNRKDYRRKHEPGFIKDLQRKLVQARLLSTDEKYYLLPEGGTNTLAVQGAAEIVNFIPPDTDYVCIACGTGGTMAGLIHGLNHIQNKPAQVIGFPVLKGAEFLVHEIQKLLDTTIPAETDDNKTTKIKWELIYNYHFGGFGKMTGELARFIHHFEQKYSIPLDPVYTAKMMYGIVELINNNYFPPHSRILIIHSGGLQGRRGMDTRIQQALGGARLTKHD